MTRTPGKGAKLKPQVRVLLDEEIALGPGKADLLEAIAHTGSISAAGKKLGMSYRRTWLLVDTMNRCFKQPLVETSTGGSRGGGARLTPLGSEVLTEYRTLQAEVAAASQAGFLRLKKHLRAKPLEAQ
ncbi:winged helix-turn-helix domain-containing protein [Marinimicrobium sp. ABcell2]|uniref:winged helix-turn-helix domain-containing protein n=1 Tax=Marinimicrobium sp. ABcell2 TaxID=3069751 RepID=UPI0027AF29AB|nr:LysR family transcriptional regulator [Marinimicrobium sp. ABcell2]MDQ2075637.1 LysR family transcriptional regulator [Marinimicrobium sp. ABcell2]